MKNIKKIFMFVFAFAFIFISSLGLVACGKNKDDGKIKIVCTIFPEYDWVQEIIGEDNDKFSVTILLDSGADMHSYQPTVKDIATVSKCDLFIYVGGESDNWTANALKNATNKNMKTLNLLEILGDSALDEDVDEDHGHVHEEEKDEHVWLSLKNAKVFVDKIANAIVELDEANKDTYLDNSRVYCEQLTTLDEAYATAVASASKDTLIFGDRFPFKYLTNDYGLNYDSAFSGCSAETEASFETYVRLANKIKEFDLNAIIKLESSSSKTAETIKAQTGRADLQILVLDSLQSTTKSSGKTYLSVMTDNLEVLKLALA